MTTDDGRTTVRHLLSSMPKAWTLESAIPYVLAFSSLLFITLYLGNWPVHLVTGGYKTDFASLWFAGRGVLHNVPVYDVVQLSEFAKAVNPTSTYANFVYPPFVLFAAIPLGTLPMWIAFPLWNGISILLFCLAARHHGSVLLVISPATLICLCFGQYGLLIGALWLWAWRLYPWAAVLLTAKPHIGFLIAPIYLSEPRRLIAPTLLALALFLGSIAAFGAEAWPAFFQKVFGYQAVLIRDDGSPNWVLQAVTPLIGYGAVGAILYALAAIVIVWGKLDVFTAASATFLITPYGFHYDMSVVCLGFGLLLCQHRLLWFERLICLLAFFSPVIVGYGTWFVPPILLLGLWVQCRNWQKADRLRHI